MTETPRCSDCKRPLKRPSTSGYGPSCARKHGLAPKPRRTRAVPRLKPAPVPNPPDVPPGQTALELFYFEATLDSL